MEDTPLVEVEKSWGSTSMSPIRVLAAALGLVYVRTIYITGKIKVKLFLYLTKHHIMKTYCGSRSIAPHILNLGSRWM
jgi:hypothetical protein